MRGSYLFPEFRARRLFMGSPLSSAAADARRLAGIAGPVRGDLQCGVKVSLGETPVDTPNPLRLPRIRSLKQVRSITCQVQRPRARST